MNKKFEKKLGKSKEPIVKIKSVDFHALSRKYEHELEKKSKKKREEEKERKKKAFISITKIKNNNPPVTNAQPNDNTGIIPISSTVTFKYNPKEESTPLYLLGQHEQREKREKAQIMSLIKQYFFIDLLEFFKYYKTPYPKEPLKISCFEELMDNENRDMTNICYLEADYDKCYSSLKLINIKNLGRYDCWEDRPPEEWFAMCQKNDEEYDGTSPMYDHTTDKYMWNPVKVLNYNPETQRYKVRFVQTEKEVTRLSLLFKWENKAEFEFRKYLCEKRRNHVDQFILFTRYVDNVPTEIVSTLSLEWEKKIEAKVRFSTKRLSDMFNYIFNETNASFTRELNVIKQDYLRQMKKCRLLLEMQEPINQPKFKERSLEIKPFYRVIPTKRCAIINKSPDFMRHLENINKKSFFEDEKFVKTLLCGFLKNCEDMKQLALILSNIDENLLPMKLEDFKSLDQSYFEKSSSNLRNMCGSKLPGIIRSFEENNDNKVKLKYDYYVATKEEYEKTLARRVVIYCNLILKTKLKELVDNSIIKFMNFFKRFGECAYSSKEKDELFSKIGTHYLEAYKPLFQTSILLEKVEGNKKKKENHVKIIFKPSLEEIKSSLLKSFTQIKDMITKEIKNICGLCFKLVDIEDKKIFVLNDDYPLYKQALDELNEIIDKSIELAENERKEYKIFMEILKDSVEGYVKSKIGDAKETKKNLNVDKCTEILDRLDELTDILNSKKSEMNVRLFFIDSNQIKEDINKRIGEVRKLMLQRMGDYCIDRTDELEQQNKEKMDKLKEETQNIDQYKNLFDLLATIPDFVKVKNEELKNVDKILTKIEQQKFDSIKRVEELFRKLLKSWMIPSQIQDVAKASSENLELKKAEYIDILKESQGNFKIEISKLEKTFDYISKVDNFTEELEGRKVSNIIQDFNEAVNKAREHQNQIKKEMKILHPEKAKEIDEGTEDLPEFEKLGNIYNDFQPFKILWNEDTNVMIEYQNKVEQKTLIELKELVPNNDKKSTKEVFVYVKDLEESRIKIEKVQKENPYDTTLIKLIEQLKQKLTYYESFNWVIQCLNSACLKEDDWKEIRRIMNNNAIDGKCKLIDLENMHIEKYHDQIELIKSKASRRAGFVAKYKELSAKYSCIIMEPKDERKLGLSKIDDVLILLDDVSNDLVNIMGNPVTQSDPKLKNDTRQLNEKIKNVQIILEEVIKFQFNYLYLEPIFNADEVNKALTAEKTVFKKVHEFWRGFMDQFEGCAWELASFMEKENFNNLNKNLNDNNKQLQEVIKNLQEYLNIKRTEFPRFFFVSDEDLLRILAQSKNPLLVQPHLSKCFEGVNHVDFNETNTIIENLVSSKDETVPLVDKINVVSDVCRGNVEVWLGQLEQSMIATMKKLAKDALFDLDKKKRIDWIKDMEWPGQLIQIIDQVVWTNGVETGIVENKLKDYLDKLGTELSEVVDLVRTNISSLLSLTLSGLIVVSVHDRDIVEKLIKEHIEKTTDFEWKAEMRYYFHSPDEDKDKKKKKKENYVPITVSMITTTLNYGFEYLGNITRLVITPLTDRCFRTLFGAYNVKYGGAPEGPAGTGKTESVKDLSKCVGVMCNVFNCTEGIKIQGMSKFFKGLASSGCWCCFDEFNRIDTEVLSVIAQQILTIQNALKAHLDFFYFEENEKIAIRDTCAINITMNPSYSGRNELPDNLKALFRPCAMMVPDYSLIAEIKLYSFGFQTAKSLSFKIVSCLKLSSEQLSSQSHYDFGMRALNAILVAAGKEKKNNPSFPEDRISLRAIIDVNLPKFTSNDTPLFYDLIHDLFPSVEPLETDLALLENMIIEKCNFLKLQPTENFKKKCIQLYQTMNVRHALMIVGRAGMAKSKVIQTLKHAVSDLPVEKGYNKVDAIILNPKSIEQKQLYGFFTDAKEWKKGLLQVKMTELCEKPKEQLKWLVFDGPVDTLWIENMNSLLDDNKKLCLEDSSSIFLADNMNIVFEVDDLKEASPATVSRNGMVLCEQDTISTDDLILSYVSNLPEKYFNEKLINQFQDNSIWVTNTVIEYLFKDNVEWGLPCDKFHLVNNYLRVFDCYMRDYKNPDEILPDDRKLNTNKVDDLIISSVILGMLGPIIKTQKLQTFLFDMCLGNDVNKDYKLNFNGEFSTNKYNWEPRRINTNIHQLENIWDFVFLIETGNWHKWMEMPGRQELKITDSLKFNELVIPTSDTLKIAWLVTSVVPNKKHLLLTGPTGTGKTLTIISTLQSNYDTDYYCYIKTSMTAQTSAKFTQDAIEKKLQKTFRKFSPLGGRKGVIFVDDLNMPQKEKYGAQPPIELLRQWMDYGGWYDLNSDNKDFVNVVDVSFLASMGSIASGRTVSSRYLRHYLIHYADTYSKKTMINIYSNITQWFFLKTKNPSFGTNVTNFKDQLINSAILMYQEVSSSFKATPAKTHYQFNLRDISKIFLGISRGNARTIKDEEDLIKLWMHECERVFKDRLVDEKDRTIYDEILGKVMKQGMRRENTYKEQTILWGDFVPMIFIDNDPKKGVIEGQYCELDNPEILQKTLNDKLYAYNIAPKGENSAGNLNLVLFNYAIEHLSRVLRIISTYNGNAVLVGVGGSGRKSLTILATFIYGMTLWKYESDWTGTLKQMMKELGNKEVVFLVADNQIDDEQIQDLNNMLNNGEIPNLIDSSDLQIIKDNIPAEFTMGKKLTNDQETMTAFIENCKAKIHFVICLSPIGDAFRKRILTFPSLVSCTNIDWYLPWPEEALNSVAKFYLDGTKEIEKSMFDSIINICVDMQNRVIFYSNKYYQELRRHNYVTPMSFIELLNIFKNLLQKRTIEIDKEINRYGNGLIILAESEKTAAEMGAYIKELEPQLKEQQEKASKQMIALNELKVQLEKDEEIGKAKEAEAQIVKKEAEEQSAIANEKAAIMEAKKIEAESKLNEIKPDDVLQIKKYKLDNTMMKFSYFLCMLCLNNPKPKPSKPDNPKDPPVYNYFDHICKNKLNKMSGSEFLKFLKKFDSTKMPLEQMKELRDKLEALTPEEFDPAKKSLAMKNIFEVIKTHNEVFFINQDYLPLKRQAEESKERLDQAEASLKEIQDKLAATLKTKEEKEKEITEARDRIEKLEKKKNQCSTRLKNANILNSSLGNEKEEWKKKKLNLELFAKNIIGDILISSGIISYLGAFTKAYREQIIYEWAKKIKDDKIPISFGGENQSANDIMRGIIGDDMEIETWKSQNLPNDNFSTDNALIMSQSRRYCLLIDPQNQALQWLKEKIKQETEARQALEKQGKKRVEEKKKEKRKDGGTGAHYTIKPTMDNKTLCDVTADCVYKGLSLIYENVGEELNQSISHLYKKEFYKDGDVLFVNINQKPIEVSDNFRFYIITQLPKPHYLPEICVSLTLVNFTVTEEGLQDQMLNYLVEKEDPTLSALRKNCIDTKNASERKKKEIETEILFQLDESKKNATEDNTILDNEKLIDQLKQSNQTSIAMAQTLVKQRETENKISQKRNFLSPVSVHVAQLFFTVCDLSSIEPVYQYSLKFYRDIFGLAISSTPKPEEKKGENKPKEVKEKEELERLERLKLNFNSILYDKICMSLFEKDKLVFSFLMNSKLKSIPMTNEEKAEFNKQIRFLVTGGSGKEFETPNPTADDPDHWISTVQWNSICELSQEIEIFKDLDRSFIEKTADWKQCLYTALTPFEQTYPEPFDNLTDFFKLIILRILRPDKTVASLKKYIAENIGEKYVVSPVFDIGKAYDESKNKTPILFIISPGADPLILIDKLCKREDKDFEDNVRTLSLGQGQEKIAVDAIDKAQIRDQEKWILLQNCHLAKSFMTMLEKKVDEIVETGSSFRLFLTALPSNVIPISIIQDSIKIVNEPPRGLKQSLQRTFNTIDENYYDKAPKPTLFKRFAFGFVFFHAMILERRKYGPLGWNIPYEFSNSDLSISLAQLKNFLEDYDDIQYTAMNYMIAEANYGGRVTDPADRRLIAILFKDICCEDILDDKYLFSGLKDYPVPADGSYKEHEEFINNQIPQNSAPEVFGLNDNADITCAISDTNSLFSTALLTLPRTVSAKAGMSTEDQVRERVIEILKKLPEKYDVDDVRMKHPNKLEESLNSVLHQELMRFNNLLGITKTSLKNIKDAIDGNAVMTNEIEAMLQSVYDNKTPEKISKVSYPSMMPFSSWVNDFLKKMEFLQNWIDNGIPSTFWISAFYFTHSFLTGILQNYARKNNIAIDELVFEFTVMSDIKEYDLTKKPDEGAYIYGFYIEGARWNTDIRLLDESLPKVLLPEMPHVWFKPTKKDENKKEVDYSCPVYRTSRRSGELLTTGQSTNFLINMDLPFDHDKYNSEHWVKRGTAIICSLNE